MTIRAAATVLAATLLAASQARAQTPADGLYVMARLGAFSPAIEQRGFGTGFDGECGLGYRFTPNLGVEGAVGYYRSRQASMPDPVTGLDILGDKTLSVVPVTGTLRATLPLGRMDLSALAGVGIYVAHLGRSQQAAQDSLTDSFSLRNGMSVTDTTLGGHVGAGLGVQVTPRISLGADLRYVFASAKFFDAPTNIGGLRLDAVLGYRF